MKKVLLSFFSCLWVGMLTCGIAWPQANVWTHRYDNARTGANLTETQLNTSTVDVNQFGKLFSYAVDADIYTQPLVIRNVSVLGKGTHDVVYVATNNNSVYAFDANNNQGANAQALWHVNFNGPGVTPVPVSDVGTANIRNPGPIGIMGTPVIDQSTGTMFLVARTKETTGNITSYVQRLHALDIGSGAEKTGGPVVVQASIPGSGYDSVGGFVTFNPLKQNQRAGLALANGRVYIAWASHSDNDPYHGWVIAYSATTLQQTGVFCVTPNGAKAGVWQSGQPVSIDVSGNIFLATGNGSFDGVRNYGESIIKLNADLSAVLDWFTPDNWAALNSADLDLGSAGLLLVPGTNDLIGAGKEGRFYVVDRSNLGHIQTGNVQIVQTFQVTTGWNIHGAPAYWSGPSGPTVYVWGEEDYLKAFSFNGSTFNTSPISESSYTAPPGMPGGFLTVSANGSEPGSGILWASLPYLDDAENAVVSGVLRAFDASDLTRELWNTRMLPARDDLGNFAKFVPPTVTNGRVYLASFSNQLLVYGLLSSQPPPTGGTITGTGVYSAAAADLTSVGTSDWGHWPGYDHKASGNKQISDITVLGAGASNYTNDPRTLSWRDGTPTASGSAANGLFASGTGDGFLVAAPADTSTRTLKVYVGGWNSRGMLTAHLSDGSAIDFADTTFSSTGQYDVVYTLNYAAAAAGQQLSVQWTQYSGGGNVTLQGAALSGGATPPPLAPTGLTASDGTSNNSVAITWNVAANATSYTVYRSTALGTQGVAIGTATMTAFTDTSPVPGTVYYYGVTATGVGGTSPLSGQDSGYASVPTGNVALASNGGVASASSSYSAGFPVSSIIDNVRTGANWGNGGGWNDATANAWPDWIQVNFSGSKTIDHLVVYTLQDNYTNPVEPTDTMTFSLYGITAFTVQGWNGSSWVSLGSVSGNNLVKRTVSFSAFTTDRIRINVTASLASFSRITEVEAWGTAPIGPAPSTTTLASSLNPSTVGANVTFTATVAGSSPTGSVNFKDGSTSISGCSAAALAGSGNSKPATCSTTALTAATHSITAVYSGDATNATSTSAVLSQVVNASTSINVALTSNGGVASASSSYSAGFPVSAIIDNVRTGANWGNGGGWNDATANAWPDWIQVNFSGSKTIDHLVVYTPQDNYTNPVEPTDTMTFSLYGITAFTVQGWNGSSWVSLGSVSGNNLVKRTVSFSAFTTDRIRINVTAALASFSRITEVEAWGH